MANVITKDKESEHPCKQSSKFRVLSPKRRTSNLQIIDGLMNARGAIMKRISTLILVHLVVYADPPSKEGKKNFVRSLANFIPKAFRCRRGASGSNGSIRTHIDSMELNKRNASSRSFNQKTSSSTIGDSNSSSRHWKPRPEHPLLRWSTKEGK